MRLFDVPPCAVLSLDEPPFPMGGLGGGHLTWDDDGSFRGSPAGGDAEAVLPDNKFHVFWHGQGARGCAALAGDAIAETRRLFPLTWRRYQLSTLDTQHSPPILESVSFSPLLPNTDYERTLPVYVAAFRGHNPNPAPLDLALMLSWTSPVPDTVYDFQHDNLCLTGSLGSADSHNRQGIAVPDLHYIGRYEQGIQPCSDPAEVVEEFCAEGELDELADRGEPAGVSAWLRFRLRAGETREAPFVIAWHYPFHDRGLAEGKPRCYTQYLGRFRPDNAIVWLAEQAFQHFGAETANYKYWLQSIRDWQDRSGLGSRLNGLAEILRADVSWTEERGFEVGELSDSQREMLLAADPHRLWPDLDLD